jgi:hypothetical protein
MVSDKRFIDNNMLVLAVDIAVSLMLGLRGHIYIYILCMYVCMYALIEGDA